MEFESLTVIPYIFYFYGHHSRYVSPYARHSRCLSTLFAAFDVPCIKDVQYNKHVKHLFNNCNCFLLRYHHRLTCQYVEVPSYRAGCRATRNELVIFPRYGNVLYCIEQTYRIRTSLHTHTYIYVLYLRLLNLISNWWIEIHSSSFTDHTITSRKSTTFKKNRPSLI